MKFDDMAHILRGVGGAAGTTPEMGRKLYDHVLGAEVRDILELGFAHGNSTLCMAAALHERGVGHLLTIDRDSARARAPSLETLLDASAFGPS